MTHGEFAQVVAIAFLKGLEFSLQAPDEAQIRAHGVSETIQRAAKDYATRTLRVWQSKLEKDE